MLESILEAIFTTIRFLVVEILLRWSPARIFRVFVLDHDPEDRDSGFAATALWYFLDIFSWAALAGLIFWLFFWKG